MKTMIMGIGILAALLAGNRVSAQENKSFVESTPVQSTVFSTTSNAPVTPENLRKGLVLHLTFDQDETVSRVTDASNSGNHGKASGVRWTAEGRKGGAYEFTADGDQIEVPNNALLNPKQLTLAAWIKTSFKDDKWRRIFDKSYNQGYAMSIAADWQGNRWSGLASLEIGPGSHFSLTRTMVADGQWHHVAATFDGSEQLLFVDSKPQGFPLRWDGPGQAGTNGFNLIIGCNRSNLGEDDLGVSFRGLIDEPMLWNRALSLREVAFLFASQGGNVEKQIVKAESIGLSSSTVDGTTAAKLLKGVVHLTDNDVRFRTADGVTVFVDPVSWPTDEAVVKSGMVKPDLILITHFHGDHFQPTILREYLNLNPKAVLAGPPDVARLAREKGMEAIEVIPGQKYSMAGIHVSTVPACFLEGDSHPKANHWVGYVLQLDGANYYVTGDTQPLPEMANLKVDVLFPLLSGCGGNLEQAVKMAELCKARVVVPVHTNGQLEVIKRYLARMQKGVQGAYYQDGKSIAVK
jgi:L-ascorbate metabolism protein UlaG (beta-lactamase superfamily)